MPNPPPDPRVAKSAKSEVALRISRNRRLEAGDELFDKVLDRMERIERRRRFRWLMVYLLILVLIVTAAVLLVIFSLPLIRGL
jgi:hypothetical protein